MSNSYKILNYGDSQGEVWDYVFYNNPNYIKHNDNLNIGWRSGWSTRGLKKNIHADRLLTPLKNMCNQLEPENILILLTFGSVDIEWNLSYKRYVLNEYPNTNVFIQEMCNSYLYLINAYQQIQKEMYEKKNIFMIITFPFSPIPLSLDYMKNFSLKNNTEYYQVISHEERFKLWNIFCEKITHMINRLSNSNIFIIDVRKDFCEDGYRKYICQDYEDHHPDLTKTQWLVSSYFKKIRFYSFRGEKIEIHPDEYKETHMYRHVRRPLR